MLGIEPEIVREFVDSGDVRLVYWPMLDHGSHSLNAHAAADCIGRQDVDVFWQIHDQFYEDQSELWNAERSYFVDAAVNAGVDRAAFEACYDSGLGHNTVTELDHIRRDLGIFNRPTFDINGALLVGSQPFSVFSDYLNSLQP